MIKDLIPWKKKNGEISKHGELCSDPFEMFHKRMNEVFNSFFDDFGAMEHFNGGEIEKIVSPGFEVSETDSEIIVSAELPGMDEKDVEVSLDENVLTIKGEKKEEKEEKKKGSYISERRYGKFERSFALPEVADAEKIKADFKKGVLKIVLPKTEKGKKEPKKINIS